MVSSWHGGGRSGGGQLVRGEKADLLVPVLGWAGGVETSRQGGELASGTEKLGSWSQVGGVCWRGLPSPSLPTSIFLVR